MKIASNNAHGLHLACGTPARPGPPNGHYLVHLLSVTLIQRFTFSITARCLELVTSSASFSVLISNTNSTRILLEFVLKFAAAN